MWCWAFVLCCVILQPNVEGFTKTVTVCQNGMLTLACPVPMSIISANYGRLDYTTCPGNCIPSQLATNSCSQANSLSVVSGICNSMLNCSVFVGNPPFGDPCGGILKYLTVTYSCPDSSNVVCDGGTLSIQCPTGLISIRTSNYGRIDSCTCPAGFAPGSIPLSNTSCTAANSLSVVNNACNGKTNCSVNTGTFAVDPCFGIAKYLTVTYSCIAISTQVACENSTLAMQCASGTIIIQSASFGRLDTTVCMGIYTVGSQQLNTTSCISPNSLSIVNSTCNGQQNCSLPVTAAAFGGDPCSGISKYLTVTFYCQVASTSNATTTCPNTPTNATICPTTTTTTSSTTSTTTPTTTTSAFTTRTSTMSTTSSTTTAPTTSSSSSTITPSTTSTTRPTSTTSSSTITPSTTSTTRPTSTTSSSTITPSTTSTTRPTSTTSSSTITPSTTSTTRSTSTTSSSTTRPSTTPTTSSPTTTATTSATSTASAPLQTTTQENISTSASLLSSSLATATEQTVTASGTSQFGSSLKGESTVTPTIAATTEYVSKWLMGALVATVASIGIASCCWIAIACVILKKRSKGQSHQSQT